MIYYLDIQGFRSIPISLKHTKKKIHKFVNLFFRKAATYLLDLFPILGPY